MTAEMKITRARTAMIIDMPWFGSLALKLRVESTLDGSGTVNGTEQKVYSMTTDGTSLVYHPPFVESLSKQELIGVIAHEVMHCALLHPYRRGNRELSRANVAMDLAINPLIIESGLKLPGQPRTLAEMQAGATGYFLDPKFKKADGSWMGFESIYGLLPESESLSSQAIQAGAMGACQDTPGTPGTGDGGKGGKGDKGDTPGSGTGSDTMSESDWQIAAKQAEMVASKAGKMPGGIARPLVQSRESITDWRTLLRRFVTATYRHDSTWARPSRRGMAAGYLMPGILKENTGEIVVAIDTSGSVTQAMLEQFRGEIQAIKDETRPERLHVVYCDARVNRHDEFTPETDVEITMCGGGGTAFTPVFDTVKGAGIEPKCLIYLTDLDSSDSPAEPDYPVLWVTPDWVSKGWSWGEIVRIRV